MMPRLGGLRTLVVSDSKNSPRELLNYINGIPGMYKSNLHLCFKIIENQRTLPVPCSCYLSKLGRTVVT